ncbi:MULTISPECIES: thiamine phosphate synthase [unclassified Beijerinckia]|uniref:thiamine phosphate synthase n=1 Tax=unclassified Beijerinckia TaxID=2638183 RepID=UPI0008994A8F|nr:MULTISPECIES: thiamine phosphate synthase [unclassified Beijerinckia]MDH7794718.1 thiamine-phosphate pyrophosphorylase [Beijerinckia sp. GAS462]SEB72504.1 thiamine-phosphate diphosphorylase [Beijerinckia sp. 28-YEA-48]
MSFDPKIWRLCLVTDRSLSHGRNLVDVVGAAVSGGVTMVQLREKDATTRQFLEEARALKALLQPLDVPLIINDRVDIALAVDAEGVHVGQTDMPVAQVRQLIGVQKIIGLSITNRTQIEREDARQADYLGIGPLYAQTTKADAATPLGVEGFTALRALTQKPVMAIGGLKASNSADVLKAGANGLAIVSAIIGADDPKAAAADVMRLF